MMELTDHVQCSSSSEYADRPVAIQWSGKTVKIHKIITRWRTPEGKYFRVQSIDNKRFLLFYDESNYRWQVCEI